MVRIIKSLRKGLFCLIAVAMLAASALMFAPVANAAQADYCGKEYSHRWGDRQEYHMNMAICPNKIVYSGDWYNGEWYEEGSVTVTGLTWEAWDPSDWGWSYTDGWHITGTISEVTGPAEAISAYYGLNLGEAFETYVAQDEDYNIIADGGVMEADYDLVGTYDCGTTITPVDRPTEQNPKTSDIDVVTMIATSALAILAIAGSVLVLKKQRA